MVLQNVKVVDRTDRILVLLVTAVEALALAMGHLVNVAGQYDQDTRLAEAYIQEARMLIERIDETWSMEGAEKWPSL